MRNRILLSFVFAIALLTTYAGGQSLDKISRRCPSPNGNVYGVILVNGVGNITHTPCPTKSSVFTGGVDFTNATVTGLPAAGVTGSGTANFIPRFTAATVLGNTPFSWDGALYAFNNTALNSEFTIDFTPSTAAGVFRVGDFTTTPTNFFTLTQSTNTAALSATTINATAISNLNLLSGATTIGDAATTQINVSTTGQRVYLGRVDTGFIFDVQNIAGEFALRSTAATALFTMSDVQKFAYQRTITAGGTTGAQVINKPVGTVNFAAGATAITVTNSTVVATSLIFATARTNDATCSVKNVVAGAGSFVINMTAACTAETSVGFFVTN